MNKNWKMKMKFEWKILLIYMSFDLRWLEGKYSKFEKKKLIIYNFFIEFIKNEFIHRHYLYIPQPIWALMQEDEYGRIWQNIHMGRFKKLETYSDNMRFSIFLMVELRHTLMPAVLYYAQHQNEFTSSFPILPNPSLVIMSS